MRTPNQEWFERHCHVEDEVEVEISMPGRMVSGASGEIARGALDIRAKECKDIPNDEGVVAARKC